MRLKFFKSGMYESDEVEVKICLERHAPKVKSAAAQPVSAGCGAAAEGWAEGEQEVWN